MTSGADESSFLPATFAAATLLVIHLKKKKKERKKEEKKKSILQRLKGSVWMNE